MSKYLHEIITETSLANEICVIFILLSEKTAIKIIPCKDVKKQKSNCELF